MENNITIDDRIKYLSERIIMQYGSIENLENIVDNRSYDKTILEKLGSEK